MIEGLDTPYARSSETEPRTPGILNPKPGIPEPETRDSRTRNPGFLNLNPKPRTVSRVRAPFWRRAVYMMGGVNIRLTGFSGRGSSPHRLGFRVPNSGFRVSSFRVYGSVLGGGEVYGWHRSGGGPCT